MPYYNAVVLYTRLPDRYVELCKAIEGKEVKVPYFGEMRTVKVEGPFHGLEIDKVLKNVGYYAGLDIPEAKEMRDIVLEIDREMDKTFNEIDGEIRKKAKRELTEDLFLETAKSVGIRRGFRVSIGKRIEAKEFEHAWRFLAFYNPPEEWEVCKGEAYSIFDYIKDPGLKKKSVLEDLDVSISLSELEELIKKFF